METSTSGVQVSLSEVLSALSHALDLTEGQPAGHTLRSCAIGMRLAEECGLGAAERSALYYALLLKDAGCSSNAARFATLFGTSDQEAKYRMKFADWHQKVSLAIRTAAVAGSAGHFLGIARTDHVTRDLVRIRCDRGAGIALRLGFPEPTAEAIRALDEHWCGKGYPEGRQGDEIPLLARIAGLAQTVETFHRRYGVRRALRVAKERRGRWFDPRLVDLLLEWRRDRAWWAELTSPELAERVVASEPGTRPALVDAEGLDAVCGAFAEIIDAKSPYTFRHSTGVAGYACGIAAELGSGPEELRRLRRAGLLHDIGKLGVSSRTLDKAGPLTPEERTEIERHPLHTWEILSRVHAFGDFARTAALHHEKLDGSGYPWGVGGDELHSEARVLAVADIYEALTADRPYRAGMAPEAALAILYRDRGTRLCADAVGALESHLGVATAGGRG